MQAQVTARYPGCQTDCATVEQTLMDKLQFKHYEMKKININLENSAVQYHNSHFQSMCRYGSYIARVTYLSVLN